MATDKTKSSDKDSGKKAPPAETSNGPGFTQQSKGDTAAKAMTKEDILALHRKSAAQKDVITSDVVGYWNSDGEIPITGIPERGVVAIDSGIDKTKPSLLMKIKATLPTIVADQDDNENVCKAGDLVGVWFKPGMRDIRTLAGVEVTIARNPSKDKDTGKGNPMKAFEIRASGTGDLLRLTEDRREKSRGAKTVFDLEQEPPSPAAIPRNATPATLYEDGKPLPF